MTRSRTALTVAVAQPACAAGDVDRNVQRHAAAVNAAAARVVVFPEMSLTGYELDTAPLIDPGDKSLAPLIQACALNNSVAFAGAPVADHQGRHYLATLAVTGTGASVAYRKMCLGSDETLRFHPGPGPAVYPVDGWRLGLAICKDTNTPAHIDATAALGLDAYLAGLVMRPDEVGDLNARAEHIARQHRIPVALASFAGATGSGYPCTAGHSSIRASNGTVLAHTGAQPDTTARTTLPAA